MSNSKSASPLPPGGENIERCISFFEWKQESNNMQGVVFVNCLKHLTHKISIVNHILHVSGWKVCSLYCLRTQCVSFCQHNVQKKIFNQSKPTSLNSKMMSSTLPCSSLHGRPHHRRRGRSASRSVPWTRPPSGWLGRVQSCTRGCSQPGAKTGSPI